MIDGFVSNPMELDSARVLVAQQPELHPLLERRPRILFFGMQSHFSIPSLIALLESGVEVCAIVLPRSPIPGHQPLAIQRREQTRARRTVLPLVNMSLQPSVIQLAQTRKIPVWEVNSLSDAETVSTLATYQPDVICVACFSLRIPRVILDLPRLGCLNVHPSLLPANRGPVPLFWTFREGCEVTGVTIHLMDEGMDSGDILAQEVIKVPDGISYAELESQCAIHGGALLVQAVWDLYEGRAVRTKQDETGSSYHSFPSDEDFVVHAEEWEARRVYNFIRGVGHWDRPIELVAGSELFLVRDVLSYSLENIDGDSGKVSERADGTVWVECKVGRCVVH
jgi:methionyl-tRNA formyltransferase